MNKEILIISLKERYNDRLLPLTKHLKEHGFNYFVFDAIKMDNGVLGLITTIYVLFKNLLKDKDWNLKLIVEDDMRFVTNNAIEMIESMISQLPEDFDIFYLGCNLWQQEVKLYSENLIKLNDAYALHSCIYSRSGMEKVLKAINEMVNVVPLDVLIKDKVQCDGKCYCSFPILSTQVAGYSNIENKLMDWSKVLHKRFEERTKHLL